MSTNLDSSYTGILVSKLNQKHIEQFNFKGWLSLRNQSGGKWVHIVDINDDGVDDFFVFHKWQNRLYLGAVDFRTREILWDVPIVDGPESDFTWDVAVNAIQFVKLHPDSSSLLLFALFTGLQDFPRGLYAFDIRTRRVVYKYESGVDITDFTVCDLDGDGFSEIILDTYTSENLPDNSPEPNDHYTWLIVLNHQLKPLVNPRRLFPAISKAISVCLPDENPEHKRIATFVTYDGYQDYSHQVIEWDHRIRVKKRIPFYRQGRIWFFWIPQFPDRIYMFSIMKNLSVLSSAYEVIASIPLDVSTLKYQAIQIDGQWHLLFVTMNEVIIATPELDVKARLPVPYFKKNFGFFISPIRSKSYRNVHFAIADGKTSIHFAVVPNLLYKFRLFVWMGFGIILSVLLLGTYSILSKILKVVSGIGIYLKNNPAIAFIIDADGRILFGKKRIGEICRIPGNARIHTIEDIHSYFPLLYQKIKDHLSILEPMELDIPCFQNSHEKYLRLKIFPVVVRKKPIAFYLELEENPYLQLSEQIELWSEAARREAHNIKTPLSSMNFSLKELELLLVETALPEQQKQEIFELLENQREAVDKILRRVLKFMKISSLIKNEWRRYDLHRVLDQTLQEFKAYFQSGNVQLIKQYDPDLPSFCFDLIKMEILFHILIENAIDAMKGQGILEITTTYHEHFHLDPYVEITIRDTGGGIPESIRDLVFKQRIPTHKVGRGSGLGLLIAKDMVSSHQGHISYELVENGTKFVINIPVNRNCEETAEDVRYAREDPGGR
ncbi:MAG: HAMP domain-containing histidine kinase [Calditrichaeota bacterium]|nr:HAMP domain-containing histidine kinase [Calditrichota bacterium]